MIRLQKVFLIVSLHAFAFHCAAQKKSWGVLMAETIMKTYPDSIVVKAAGETAASRPKRAAQWNYEYGVLL